MVTSVGVVVAEDAAVGVEHSVVFGLGFLEVS